MPKMPILILIVFAVVFANADSSKAIKDQYIIVLKDSAHNSNGSLAIKKSQNNKQKVRETAEKLMLKAKKNQLDIDKSRDPNNMLVSKSEKNKLGHIYGNAINGFSAKLTPEAVELLKNHPDVLYIEKDERVSINAVQSPTGSWGLDRIDTQILLLDNNYTYDADGVGVHVYVIDSGIRGLHDEFVGRVGNGYDFINNDSTPEDNNGHGTHVAGTIGGSTYGVAKKTILHAVKVLDSNGSGTLSGLLAGIDWVTENHRPPAVINMSLSTVSIQLLKDAVNTAIDTYGLTTVVAAGNDYGDDACLHDPASVTNAITVASSDENDIRSSFSNIGICVDIFAPGSYIRSASAFGTTSSSEVKSGTSMAAPHVAGVAALFLETHPSASPIQVADVLIEYSTKDAIADTGTGTPNRLLYNKFSADLSWFPAITNHILNY